MNNILWSHSAKDICCKTYRHYRTVQYIVEEKSMQSVDQAWYCCVMNLENNQNDYAWCLDTILWLEGLSRNESQLHQSASDDILGFYLGRTLDENINDLSRLRKIEEALLSMDQPAKDSDRVKYFCSRSSFLNYIGNNSNKLNLCYYLRIHLTVSDDIVNLQYAVLLLQLLSKIHPRIAIHIRCSQEGANIEMISKCSNFLRLVNTSYPCFYIQSHHTSKHLEKLGSYWSDSYTNHTFFPLLLINSNLLSILSKKWLVKYNPIDALHSDKSQFEARFSLEGCNDEKHTLPLFKTCIRMIREGIKWQKYISVEKKNKLGCFICQQIEALEGITLLELALFAVIGMDAFQNGLNPDTEKASFEKTLEKAYLIQQFGNAVYQLIENVVYHSQNEEGVFTFRLHDVKTVSYLESNYPGYVSKLNMPDDSKERHYLELLISDGNLYHNIMSHFLKREENRALTSLGIQLADFFGHQTKETEGSWNKVHQERPELCHGLRIFASILQSLNGTFRVNSSSRIYDHGPTDFYYQFDSNKQEGILEGQKYWLPGTQYSILVDRRNMPTKKQMLFDSINTQYATTAADLLPVLECKQITNIEIPEAYFTNVFRIETQEEKNNQIEYWRNCFDMLYDQNKVVLGKPVYSFTLDSHIEKNLGESRIETFCKGFLSSQFFRSAAGMTPSRYVLLCGLSNSGEFDKIFPLTFAIYANRLQNQLTPVYVFYSKGKKNNQETTPSDWLQPYLGIRPTLGTNSSPQTLTPRLFPLALFPQSKDQENLTPFERDIRNKANKDMCAPSEQGYKIKNTHMRLGNKVHLDTFYEMSLFFEDPNNAYYTAFLFVQKLINCNAFTDNTHLILYGYASYCSAILWAMRELLQLYIDQKKLTTSIKVDFIIYQNDLKIESNRTKIQMYYSNPDWQNNPEQINDIENITLVQIVPIASSLTTFEKMYVELERETRITGVNKQINFTATWVKNDTEPNAVEKQTQVSNCNNIILPTEVEKAYWKEADAQNRIIKTNLSKCNTVEYLVSVASKWCSPLSCPLCFPQIENIDTLFCADEALDKANNDYYKRWRYDHSAIFEVPLIDTDSTSTVPTQQLYTDKGKTYERVAESEAEKTNDTRIAKLRNNLLCRHVSRGKNHYQYYVRTRNYFQQERASIRDWLVSIREHEQPLVDADSINVLVIPRHASSVEFGQYVYEYYFRGEAKSIIVNTEKVFRSNFRAEYRSVFQFLKNCSIKGKSINFYYVDVALTSGDSFRRAASLVSSCLHEHDLNVKNGQYLFSKVFMLINRMSQSSIRDYVSCAADFHAYADLKISSMRSFGNSCVPCKLQAEAEFLFKNAATKSVSEYWDRKRYERKCIPFDLKDMDDAAEDYRRLACTHRAAHYFEKVRGSNEEHLFAALRDFISEIQSIERVMEKRNSSAESESHAPYLSAVYNDDHQMPQNESAGNIAKEWLSAAFKIMARPFYSYDFHVRKVVMDMFLILSEVLLKDDGISDIEKRLRLCLNLKMDGLAAKKYLLCKSHWETDHLEWLVSLAQWIRSLSGSSSGGNISQDTLEWWRDNLLKGLVDMKSNYILRKETISAVQQLLANFPDKQSAFWDHYLRSIMRLIHSSRDDTKSVWLEEQLLNYHL